MGIANLLFPRSVPAEKAAVSPFTTASGFLVGQRLPRKKEVEGFLAYERNPRIYSVGDKIARSVACTRWVAVEVRPSNMTRLLCSAVRTRLDFLHRQEIIQSIQSKAVELPEGERVNTHPLLVFLAKGNRFLLETEVLRMTQLCLDLDGICSWAVFRNGGGSRQGRENLISDPNAPPTALFPFPRMSMKAVNRGDKTVTFTLVGNVTATFPAADVFTLRYARPSNPYAGGMGFVSPAGTEIAIDESAAGTIAGRLSNQGLPNAIVTVKGIANDKVKQNYIEARLEEKFGGPQKAGRPFVTGSEIAVETLDEKLVDLGLTELRVQQGDIILETPGVPPEIIGRTKDANRATSQVAQEHYAETVILPRVEYLRAAIQSFLVPLFEPGNSLFIGYESFFPVDPDLVLDAADLAPQAYTVNEIRGITKLPPRPDGNITLAESGSTPRSPANNASQGNSRRSK